MEALKEKTIDELKEYREQLSKLTEEEKKKRDLYLKKMADGTLEGPSTGYSSIDKQWLKYYSDDAIESDLPQMTALSYMKENNKDNLNGIALNFFGLKMSYRELFKKIDEVSKALVSFGVKQGDVVVINSVTLPQTIFLLYALNKIGAIADLTDLRTDANGMKHYFDEGNAKLVFTLDTCYLGFKDILNETSVEKIVLLNPTDTVPLIGKIGSSLKENNKLSLKEKQLKRKEKRKIDNILKTDGRVYRWSDFLSNKKENIQVIEKDYEKDYPIAIVHTSGTTSTPKSVVLTNDNFNAMSLQYSVSDFKYAKGESLLNIIPIFVAYGVVNSLHMPLCLGMTNIVYPKVVGADFPDIIKKFKPNHVIAIPMHWEYLLHNESAKTMDLSFLKTAACGGDNLNVELEKKLNDFLLQHNSKSKIVKGYGMTEISACAVTNTNNNSKVGSVGIPLVKNNISIIDPDTGLEVRLGQKGEICMQSPTIMKEYLNNKEATVEAMKQHADGGVWLHSGDLGHFDNDANLMIDGRLKRLIIRRGFKISAVAIENVIMKNENVESCAVVKAPHDEDGETPFVFIVLKENISYNTQILKEINEMCLTELPEYYVPEFNNFVIVKELPYTKNGKLDLVSLEKIASSEIKTENISRKVK